MRKFKVFCEKTFYCNFRKTRSFLEIYTCRHFIISVNIIFKKLWQFSKYLSFIASHQLRCFDNSAFRDTRIHLVIKMGHPVRLKELSSRIDLVSTDSWMLLESTTFKSAFLLFSFKSYYYASNASNAFRAAYTTRIILLHGIRSSRIFRGDGFKSQYKSEDDV